jgi:hypothetical protein
MRMGNQLTAASTTGLQQVLAPWRKNFDSGVVDHARADGGQDVGTFSFGPGVLATGAVYTVHVRKSGSLNRLLMRT